MSEKSSKGRCVHCLKFTDDMTDDHVFPRSWYPDSTPATVQRWTVPCCRRCNKALGALESDLLLRMGLCLDPNSQAAKGVREKALQSLGLNVRELAPEELVHRENRLKKLKAELIPVIAGEQPPGAIPGLVQKSRAAEWAVPIPWAGLSIIAEKIARGCEYKANDKRFVEPPYAVTTYVSEHDIVSPQFLLQKLVNRYEIDFGPGCQIIRVSPVEDKKIVRYRILIWGSLCFHALLDHEDYLRSGLEPNTNAVEGISPEECKGMRI